jgi:hypothetical protein
MNWSASTAARSISHHPDIPMKRDRKRHTVELADTQPCTRIAQFLVAPSCLQGTTQLTREAVDCDCLGRSFAQLDTRVRRCWCSLHRELCREEERHCLHTGRLAPHHRRSHRDCLGRRLHTARDRDGCCCASVGFGLRSRSGRSINCRSVLVCAEKETRVACKIRFEVRT